MLSHVHHRQDGPPRGSDRLIVATILLLLVGYGVALVAQVPQSYTAQIVAHDEGSRERDDADASHDSGARPPALWALGPLVVLLGAIAALPLVSALHHWWEDNRNRLIVAVVLSVVTLAYYAWLHDGGIYAHWPHHRLVPDTALGWNLAQAQSVFSDAILGEYIPFITLLFSLYVISGGIRIAGDLRASSLTNVSFIAVGGLLASFIGTTGAAMLLIRPLLETNRERQHVVHTVVFFIFVVCNCGGCLLPIGDPPLFLGYLRGVPFLWTMTALWWPWLVVNLLLLAIYFLLDRYWYFPRETAFDRFRDQQFVTKLRFEGMWLQVPLLIAVVVTVALLDPTKSVPGTNWHPWLYLREALQLALVAISLGFGSREVRVRNQFTYGPIAEVAALFIGIFICMQPALQLLYEYGAELGVETPRQYYWITGGLSSILDNAPTYVVMFETATAVPLTPEQVAVPGTQVAHSLLVAISLGAVLMGAGTYIGNGPNFMVRAIAEKAGVPMPSFFGYIAYSGIFLLPVLLVAMWLFVPAG